MAQGADSTAAAFVEVFMEDLSISTYGVAIHANIVTASILAMISAINRCLEKGEAAQREEMVATIAGLSLV